MTLSIRRFCVVLVVCLFPIVAAGCGTDLHGVLVALALADPLPGRPLESDILCDSSKGSSCSVETLDSVASAVLAKSHGRPGSKLRVWILGATVAESRKLFELTVSAATATTMANDEKLRRDDRARLRAAIAGVRTLIDSAHPAASPVAYTIAKIALASDPVAGTDRLLVIVGDALEESDLAHLECGKIPTADRFVRALQTHAVLPTGQLEGVRVVFAYNDIRQVDSGRCDVVLDRVRRVRTIWAEGLKHAGARSVSFLAQSPDTLPLP